MERKIGEIFEYNGGWYQCLIGTRCRECDFSRNNVTCDIHGKLICTCKGRSDQTSVVFKKLEKVGEPYEYFVQGIGIITVQEYILANATYIWEYNQDVVVMDCQNGKVAIEIKQNKEDMEENNDGNTPLNELTDRYVNGSINYDEFEKEVKSLYSCKKEDMEEKKLHLKPFDLAAAKQGKPVCTRDGRKARIICFDRKGDMSIAALITNKDIDNDNKVCETEEVHFYYENGRCNKFQEYHYDLMMLPEKKEGWVNVYREESNNNERLIEQTIYKTRKDAFEKACPQGYITTTKINWEE